MKINAKEKAKGIGSGMLVVLGAVGEAMAAREKMLKEDLVRKQELEQELKMINKKWDL